MNMKAAMNSSFKKKTSPKFKNLVKIGVQLKKNMVVLKSF